MDHIKDKIESINATKLFNHTDRYLDKEQYDKAIESAQQIIDGDNESSIGYEFMAMALIGLKRYEEALSYCNMALERITDLETPSMARQLKRDCIDAIYREKHSSVENINTDCEQSDILFTPEISDNEKQMENNVLNSLDEENPIEEATDIIYYQNDILQKYVKFGYKSMDDDISITYLENGVRCLEKYEICTMFSIAMPTFLEFIDKEFDKEDLEVSIKLKGQELLYNDGTIDEPIFYGIVLPDTGENVVIYGERKNTLPVLPIDLKITAMTISDADWNFNITEYDEDYEDGEIVDVFGFYPKEDKTILGDRLQYFKNAIINHLDKETITCSIFYDNWQMECCGNPFKIGDVIDWEVLVTKETIQYGKAIDYYYEAHNSANEPYYNIKGKVKHIYITDTESSAELIEISEVDFNKTHFDSDIIIELEEFECSDLIIPKDYVEG